MKCLICGRRFAKGQKTCPKCGNNLEAQRKEEQTEIINILFEKINFCKELWLVTGILQIGLGAVLFCNTYGVPIIVAGVISVVHWHGLKEEIENLKRDPIRIVTHFEQGKTGMTMLMIFNIFLGGVIGAIPPIYHKHIMNYVKKNKEAIYNKTK